MRIILTSIILLCFFSDCESDIRSKTYGTIAPQDLRCEYLSNPAVVDVKHPRLSWVNQDIYNKRGLFQTAYQIRVASSKELLVKPDLWDSKKVDSDENIRIKYAGEPLQSRQDCWWQVRVWDQDEMVSNWSEPNFWHMGLLNEEDWQAKWIGAPWQGEEAFPRPEGGPNGLPKDFGPPAPMFRKNFVVKKKIKKAVAYVTGLGYFEFYANGSKVGDDVLVPNQTNYGKRPKSPTFNTNVPDDSKKYKVMYLAYDISDKLKVGENVIGSIVGNGFYNPAKFWCEGFGTPRFLCQIHIIYEDGSESVLVSDETWKTAKSPILMNMVYYGEDYDARQEQKGWSKVGFDDRDWEPIAEKKAPYGSLVAHTAYADKVTERLNPISINKLEEGHFKVDFGVEISGWVRLNNVNAPAGHKIEISFNGNEFSGDNSYIFKGGGNENYAPRFNWFVFSSIEIKNWHGDLLSKHLTAEAVNTYIEETATFETSNPLFNDLSRIWRRSQVDNMHGGIASDCPHRERNGYTGDGQVVCATVMHNYDARNFYYKWIQDINDAQINGTGYVPNGAPWQPGCGGGVAWGAAINIMPWSFYVHYGAKDILYENYEAMKGYINYMKTWVDEEGIMFSQRKGTDGKVNKWFNLSDWEVYQDRHATGIADGLVHTFYFWKCVSQTSKTAKVLGNDKEARYYQKLADKTKSAFHQRFYQEKLKTYGKFGSNVFALAMGLPEDYKNIAVNALKENIDENNGHPFTGIFGTRYLFEILAENGLNDLAYTIMNRRKEPSFGRWLDLGSTTFREKWDEGGSYNHPMFGGGLVWWYRNLAGIKSNPNKPGYKEIVFKPQPLDELEWIKYYNRTVRGKAGIFWENNENKFIMNITIPVGSTAIVYIPATSKNIIRESEELISDSNLHIEYLRQENGYTVFEVQSGDYQFTVDK